MQYYQKEGKIIMGGSKQYREDGGFDRQTYRQAGTTYNGIKILENLREIIPVHR